VHTQQYYWWSNVEITWKSTCALTRQNVIDMANAGQVSTITKCALALLVIGVLTAIIVDVYFGYVVRSRLSLFSWG
jgi:hypothetical protein